MRAPLQFTVTEIPRPERPEKKSRKRQPYAPKAKTIRSLECANCGVIFNWHRDKAFCTNACKSIADMVRYRRSVLERYPNGVPEDVTDAVRTKMAHVLSGGYDKDGRRLTRERRAEVWARDAGKCVLCGADGEEVDHIDGSSADLSNLRLLCKACHHEVTESHFRPIADDDVETKALAQEIWLRVESPEPLQDCDALQWSEREAWRRWVRAHERTGQGCA